MSPILTSVEKIIKGKEEYLRFYVKDPNFYTDYLINTKKNGCRFIIKPCYRNPLDEGNKTYYLIEEVSQVDMRLKSTEDFKYCIFLIDADFRSFSFVKKSNFYRAIFTQHANFSLAVFNQIVDFSRAKFMQDVDFSNAEFTQSTYFLGAKFIKNVNFFNARIHHIVNFAYATIGSLDLSHAIIERIMYEDIVLTSANRQTFLIFRDLCINMNNHQNAIFHQITNFLKTPLALLGVDLKNFQFNKICHFANHPYLCKGLI